MPKSRRRAAAPETAEAPAEAVTDKRPKTFDEFVQSIKSSPCPNDLEAAGSLHYQAAERLYRWLDAVVERRRAPGGRYTLPIYRNSSEESLFKDALIDEAGIHVGVDTVAARQHFKFLAKLMGCGLAHCNNAKTQAICLANHAYHQHVEMVSPKGHCEVCHEEADAAGRCTVEGCDGLAHFSCMSQLTLNMVLGAQEGTLCLQHCRARLDQAFIKLGPEGAFQVRMLPMRCCPSPLLSNL